ncbi:MAG TPA: serine hydrolase domain-containing protein [Planctomycetaceae bacterium]|jgi:CubicO group peptidase (beta-lactamase class C family)|nr:serine hydrolase domain-containing protein [Planctomycetaceae bacterium]
MSATGFEDDARQVGLDPRQWQRTLELLGDWCRRGLIPSAAVICGRSDRTTKTHVFGNQTLDPASPPVRDDVIFLVASITKPIVAMGALLLVERGLLSLDDRVCEIVSQFRGRGKYGVTVRHLLTHSSGLPDMLPQNRELRESHASLDEFVAGTCAAEMGFPPGRGVRYQSMGFGLLGAIIHTIAGRTCSEFLHSEIFQPLWMNDTSLGAPDKWYDPENGRAARIAEIRVPEDQREAASDWGWNSRYWRGLGAPWGGVLSTPRDLARFAQAMLSGGTLDGTRVFAKATVEAATRNQLAGLFGIPVAEREGRPWGFGWRLSWPGSSPYFGDLLGPRMYGHMGATGTVLWIDPDRDAFAVILTTQPQEPQGTYLARLSNAIAASLV